jgi:hypothetical protein
MVPSGAETGRQVAPLRLKGQIVKKLIALLVVAGLMVFTLGCPPATTSGGTKSTGGSGGPTSKP